MAQKTKPALAPIGGLDSKTQAGAAPQPQMALRSQRAGQNSRQPVGVSQITEERLATGLAWFSIGLGLAEVFAPKGLAKLIGVNGNHVTLFRFLGLREIASGVGILTNRRPAGWLWSRVAGDAMDLSLLTAAMTAKKSNKTRLAVATAAVAGVSALDVYEAQQLTRSPGAKEGIVRAQSISINRPPEEVYQFWRNFRNLPRFMRHLESVQVIDERRSRWVAKAPAGMTVEWDAEIIEDRPNELLAWRSLEGAEVDNSGSVHFLPAPGNRGTEVKVQIAYNPPGGILGVGIAKLFGEEPQQQVKGDLARFKQVMETGEIVQSDASIHRGPHPGQPS
jgi:uncharacterized membrane protein